MEALQDRLLQDDTGWGGLRHQAWKRVGALTAERQVGAGVGAAGVWSHEPAAVWPVISPLAPTYPGPGSLGGRVRQLRGMVYTPPLPHPGTTQARAYRVGLLVR